METEWSQDVIVRIAVVMITCTLLLTAAFIGLIAIIQNDISGLDARIPGYLVGSAIVFAATVILLELNEIDGKTIISSAIFTGFASFWLFMLGFEGVYFAVNNPGEIVNENLIFYIFAAALFATSLGFWGLKHWREFISDSPQSL